MPAGSGCRRSTTTAPPSRRSLAKCALRSGVIKDVDALAEAGTLRKRARGEAIAAGVSAYWRSPEGGAEARRRSETLRSAPPVDRVCGSCGARFLLSAKRARQEPGRFCSRECADVWHSENRRQPGRLVLLRLGRLAWRQRAHDLKGRALTLDEMCERLASEGVPRTRAALLGYIHRNRLSARRPRRLGRSRPHAPLDEDELPGEDQTFEPTDERPAGDC